MQGDFSVLPFDPRRHDKPAATPADGVLRNLNGVLHQQGRVTLDADGLDGQLLELDWQGQAGRDIIGAGICAVPAADPDAFRVEAAFVSGGLVHVRLRPGRAWADGILTRLAGLPPDPKAAVERLATPFGPPIATPPGPIGEGARDAVILDVSEESLHGFQYPARLIEAALGGPDTAERAFVNFRIRLLRLGEGEDCHTIGERLTDDPADRGRLTASLAPVVVIAGDCPVVGGGGYTGFEHCLYRIEIADTAPADPARFKWSQWNGGLVGRGSFDATTTPNRVMLDAGRAAIVHSGLTEFYLEALEYDALAGAWQVVYGTLATLNTEHDLELAAPASFGALPSTLEPVFIRLWNGIADIAAFPATGTPVELRDGIRLAFDAPGAGNYRPGDYWTFPVRAGGVANPDTLVDDAPPLGIVYHRVPLAEIHWTAGPNNDMSATIEDCRQTFPPLTAGRRSCCTFLVGDGISSFGDFNSLEEAAAHLPAAGGELCLLPGLHRANLRLEGRRAIRIHGCAWRTLVIPRAETRAQPLLHFIDCDGIDVCDLDLLTFDGIAVRIDGTVEGRCRELRIHRTRMIARTNAIRATNAAELVIANNRLHLLDTSDGRATISSAADDVLIERNTLLLLPFVERPPNDDGGQPPDDPADPCADPLVLYLRPAWLRTYALGAWSLSPAALAAPAPYRALGGIHVRAGSERVRILENRIAGGAGNGITLGGDIDPPEGPSIPIGLDTRSAAPPPPLVRLGSAPFVARMEDEAGQPLTGVDLFLEADSAGGDRSDAMGMVSVKMAPGSYRATVAPPYGIARIADARDEAGPLSVVTLVRVNRAASVRGFLHQIGIERNDVAMMGLSGIGFALRAGALPGEPAPPTALPLDPREALLAALDAVLLNMGITPLLRATDPVRDLVIENNRLHDNLRNPFTREMLAQAALIGRGGISLAIVEAAAIRANHIERNGTNSAGSADPACGVFVGYGDNLELTDNLILDNGMVGRGANPGIRGGVYIRFAAALTARLSNATGRHPALRVHDNRVDQPAGRALTAYAFGPVSVANNHLNSELAGVGSAIDPLVGTALLYNLGGIHRAALRLQRGLLNHVAAYTVLAERALPGGETLFEANFLRHGIENRTLTSQLLLCLDDLGYDGNTSSSYRADPLFANALLAADTVRATGSRFREDAARTISLLTLGTRMNMTTQNQADHCIVARPPAGPGPLPTVDQPNQVLDPRCGELFGARDAPGHALFGMLRAGAEPGGAPAADDFDAAGLEAVARAGHARAAGVVAASGAALAMAHYEEAGRLASRHGAGHPLAEALAQQAQSGLPAAAVLAASAETLGIAEPGLPKGGATLAGRVVNDRGQGLAGYGVELLRQNGDPVEAVGLTDAAGVFSAGYDARHTAALQGQGLLRARVLDREGRELVRGEAALQFAPEAQLRLTLVVLLRTVPRAPGGNCTVPEGPPAHPPTHTPLDRMNLDERTRKQLARAHIDDVESILALTPEKLAGIVGTAERAQELIDAARALLDGAPPA
jgi:hypothetical protein